MNRAQDLMQRATDATALSRFGADSFREGLERLVISVDAEAGLTAQGAAAFDATIVDLLAKRLEVEDWYHRHPEIDEERIEAPLIGLGLPRTGSTAFSHMLGLDPATRSLRTWEAMAPCPPPATVTEQPDPRIAMAEASMVRRARMFPRMQQMLPSTATSPSECQTLMGQNFASQIFHAFAHVPSYTAWLVDQADLVPTYVHVKRVLKLLQWGNGTQRWRLKNPSHSLFIGALVEVFPDARFWMTHRDPAQVVGSVASVYDELSSAYSDQVDRKALGAMNTRFCVVAMERMIAYRDAGNDDRFFDVDFATFQRDPLVPIEALYRWLGEDLTDATRAAMLAWRTAMPRDKHGSHSYDPATFGLDAAALRARFGFYTARFGLTT
ncbi:MAG: sulfotransferase [Novosphingobium sp.]